MYLHKTNTNTKTEKRTNKKKNTHKKEFPQSIIKTKKSIKPFVKIKLRKWANFKAESALFG